MLNPASPIKFESSSKPQLIIVIDTEEEFDWSSPPDRKNIAVSAMSKIHLVQDIFNEYGIVPCYVVDFPIASQEQAYAPLKEFLDKEQCEIGAHCHPWVNPPFDEEVTISNMYPGNLGYDIEKNKISELQNKIADSFNIQTEIYKAGRYGVGEYTTRILEELGFSVDLSVCSAFDYRADGGPDFSDALTEPYWFGNKNLLEIPLSGAFVGMAGVLSKPLYNLSGHFNIIKARGILSKLSIVDRLMLSPEGYTTKEHIKLTRYLLKKGVRKFTWNFHSPSVVPNKTMYTNNNKQVEQFLDSFRRYFDFFLGELSGVATTPLQLKAQLER